MKKLLLVTLLAVFFTHCSKEDLADFYVGTYDCDGFRSCSCGVSSGYIGFQMKIIKTGANTVDIVGLVSCDTLQAIVTDNSLEFNISSKCNRSDFAITRSGNDLNFSYESSFNYCNSICNVYHEGTGIRK